MVESKISRITNKEFLQIIIVQLKIIDIEIDFWN
jgi:hypothetical protein